MEKEFIPYEQALALKELGFDEECLGFYDGKGNTNLYFNKVRDASGDFKPFIRSERLTWFSAPTFSQAFRWFREEHGVECFIKHFKPNDGYPNGYYCISNPNKYYSNSISDWCFTNFKSYEEAELECLKKLIEIVSK